MLTSYDWIYGSAQIGAVFLSIIAGIIAITLFSKSVKQTKLHAWKYLIPALVLFALEEILGALRTFGIWSTPHLTHVVPSLILGFLITALIVQLSLNRGMKV